MRRLVQALAVGSLFVAVASAEFLYEDNVTEALAAVTNFDSRKWLSTVDVPTTLVVTTKDRAVPAQEQLRLLLAIPHAQVHLHDEGHTWCAKPSFGRAVLDACLTVTAEE